MKCIQFLTDKGISKIGTIIRCPDVQAEKYVRDKEAEFVSKEKWKELKKKPKKVATKKSKKSAKSK